MPMGTGYLQFLKDEERRRAEDSAKPLVSCPVCGNGLDVHPTTGRRNCDVGHFNTDRTTVGGL